jgi:hypothetical protein
MVSIDTVPDKIQNSITGYNKAVKDKKTAEAEMKILGSEITNFGRKHQDKEAFNGNYRKSYKLEGESDSVKFVTSDKFSIDPEDEAEIKKILKKNFSSYIEEKFKVNIRPEIFENEDLQKEFMGLIGDRFNEFFETELSLATVKDFDQSIYQATPDQDSLDELRIFVKQNKPALK